jgi:DNA-binding GntR family transcriptional regulator
MILDGTHKPGAKLAQEQLARQFGVARSVVREALLELQASGLVESIDNRGVFVSRLDLAKLMEAFDVREALEGMAVRLCCERTTRMELRELAEKADRIYSLGVEGKLEEMASLDREFHHDLLRLSGNSILVRLSEAYRVFGKVIRLGRDPKVVRDEHRSILRGVEANDPQEAERWVHQHIQSAKRMVEEQGKAGAFVPRWVL